MLQRHLWQHRLEDKYEHLRTSYSTTDRKCLSRPNRVTADTLVKRMKADAIKMILKKVDFRCILLLGKKNPQNMQKMSCVSRHVNYNINYSTRHVYLLPYIDFFAFFVG